MPAQHDTLSAIWLWGEAGRRTQRHSSLGYEVSERGALAIAEASDADPDIALRAVHATMLEAEGVLGLVGD